MEQLAVTVDEAAELGGPRRAKLYEEIRAGRLRAVKAGRCTRILISDYQAYLASLPAIEPRSATLPDQKDAAPRENRVHRGSHRVRAIPPKRRRASTSQSS
jgi:excisionase family DNA binding protein